MLVFFFSLIFCLYVLSEVTWHYHFLHGFLILFTFALPLASRIHTVNVNDLGLRCNCINVLWSCHPMIFFYIDFTSLLCLLCLLCISNVILWPIKVCLQSNRCGPSENGDKWRFKCGQLRLILLFLWLLTKLYWLTFAL